MIQPKLKPTEPWTCTLCFAKGQGYPSYRLHNKEVHGAKPGWMNRGRKTKRGKHLRQSPEKT